MKPELSISILDCPLVNLTNFLTTTSSFSLHLDLIDTSYCDNISFGVNQIIEIIKLSKQKAIDLHIMIQLSPNLIKILKKFKDTTNKIRDIYIQIRTKNEFKIYYKKYIKEIINDSKDKLCLAIDPDFSIKEINEINNFLKEKNIELKILQMTVKSGKGKQSFYFKSNELIKKIKLLKELGIKSVGIDGGINLDNLKETKGADFIIIGSSYHNSNKEIFIKKYNEYFSK